MIRFRKLTMQTALVAAALVVLVVACAKKDKSKETTSSTAETPSDTSRTTTAIASFRAFGNEPFWSVTINSSGLHFSSPEDSAGVDFPLIEPVVAADTLHWSSKSDRGSIDVRIWRADCSDGMSDQTHTHSSTVRLNETNYVGCAQVLLQ